MVADGGGKRFFEKIEIIFVGKIRSTRVWRCAAALAYAWWNECWRRHLVCWGKSLMCLYFGRICRRDGSRRQIDY
jgi:hypothetical protein